MIETLFNPPHSATSDEIAKLWTDWPIAAVRDYFERGDDERRLLGIWRLYEFRGDEAKMRETEARFEDQTIVEMELRYRDVYPVGYLD